MKAEPDLLEADTEDSKLSPKSRSTVKQEDRHHASVISSTGSDIKGKFEPISLFDELTDDSAIEIVTCSGPKVSVKNENSEDCAVKVEPKLESNDDVKDSFKPIDLFGAGKKRLFDEMANKKAVKDTGSDDETKFSANENDQVRCIKREEYNTDTDEDLDSESQQHSVVRIKVEGEFKKDRAEDSPYGDRFLLARQSYVQVEIAGEKKNITKGMLKLGGGNVSPDMWCHKDKDRVSHQSLC